MLVHRLVRLRRLALLVLQRLVGRLAVRGRLLLLALFLALVEPLGHNVVLVLGVPRCLPAVALQELEDPLRFLLFRVRAAHMTTKYS